MQPVLTSKKNDLDKKFFGFKSKLQVTITKETSMNLYPHTLITTAVALFASALTPLYAQNQCGLAFAFDQPNLNAKSGKTPVKKTADGKALMFVTGLNVNTDGTARSYSVDDFWGESKAINNLCNAMGDACAGLSAEQLRERRILTQAAAKEGWPKDKLLASKISASIIPNDSNGKPCSTPDGYLVSATSLVNPTSKDKCDLSRYVDALTVSALVLPKNPAKEVSSGFAKNNAQMGDLAAVWLRDSQKVFFAVVGDYGPAKKLGEATVGLNGKLLGKTEPPANRLQLLGKQAPHLGQSWNVRNAVMVVFPGSRNTSQPWTTQERIDAAAKPLFEQAGGLSTFLPCS